MPSTRPCVPTHESRTRQTVGSSRLASLLTKRALFLLYTPTPQTEPFALQVGLPSSNRFRCGHGLSRIACALSIRPDKTRYSTIMVFARPSDPTSLTAGSDHPPPGQCTIRLHPKMVLAPFRRRHLPRSESVPAKPILTAGSHRTHPRRQPHQMPPTEPWPHIALHGRCACPPWY